MKKSLAVIMALGIALVTAKGAPMVKMIQIDRGLSKEAQSCVECHSTKHPGIIEDWLKSRHAHANVTCIDCHQVTKESGMPTNSCPKAPKDLNISVLVSPITCMRCHPNEHKDFSASGHTRAALQVRPSEVLSKLKYYHEGQAINGKFTMKYGKDSESAKTLGDLVTAPDENGCQQCHGTVIKLDEKGRPTPETWPNPGMGNIYPDGGIGNCVTCHTRHRFDIAEARKPDACASCHLGPDHPNIEIFENSKHGHIFKTQGHEYNYDAAPDVWEPGDYRAPTCVVCHMSGIGDLKTTHNVSRRLYWNLWAPLSKPRTAGEVPVRKIDKDKINGKDNVNTSVPGYDLNYEYVKEALTGHPTDPDAARSEMKRVCTNCHSKTHTEGFFKQADKQVHLYNEAFYKPAKRMFDDLKEKGLMKKNPWKDDFFVTFYHLWHHEGRRMRMGALMQAPDYSHWHGSWEVFQDLYELQEIYEERTGIKDQSDHDNETEFLKKIEEYKKNHK